MTILYTSNYRRHFSATNNLENKGATRKRNPAEQFQRTVKGYMERIWQLNYKIFKLNIFLKSLIYITKVDSMASLLL